MKKPNSNVKCFICGRAISEKDMTQGEVEMIKGPGFLNEKSKYYRKKVFVCTLHEGVTKQVKQNGV